MATRRDYLQTRDQVALARGLAESNAWGVFADCCQDAVMDDVPLASELAELSRMIPRFESLRRAGMTISREEAMRYAELHEMFNLPEAVNLEANGQVAAVMSGRVGPFYTKLRTDLSLASHWDWLTNEPIRELELTNLVAVDDLGLILRNHRMNPLNIIRLHFSRRGVNPAHVADLVKGMTSELYNCFELFIYGIDDRLKLIRIAFNMLRLQPHRGFLRGAKLYINGRPE